MKNSNRKSVLERAVGLITGNRDYQDHMDDYENWEDFYRGDDYNPGVGGPNPKTEALRRNIGQNEYNHPALLKKAELGELAYDEGYNDRGIPYSLGHRNEQIAKEREDQAERDAKYGAPDPSSVESGSEAISHNRFQDLMRILNKRSSK
jgi:hypothetical protein